MAQISNFGYENIQGWVLKYLALLLYAQNGLTLRGRWAAMAGVGRREEGEREADRGIVAQVLMPIPLRPHTLELRLKASYTSSLRPHTLVAEGRLHL